MTDWSTGMVKDRSMCGKTLGAMTHGQAHGQDTRIVTDAVMDTDTDKTRHTDKPRG